MSALNILLVDIIVIIIMSYGLGLILGGPERANKIISWELKKLTTFGRWILKHLFQTIANIFGYLAKQAGSKKKP